MGDLIERVITPCTRQNRTANFRYRTTTSFNCQRHKVENMFSKIEGWRRIRTRYTAAPTPSGPPSASQQKSNK